ncbi:MAG: hypothetical protein H7210_01635 [Pyrinomonadaceae bacterium]|nr:hypothetical protein [Phycisphaerales bacterium]
MMHSRTILVAAATASVALITSTPAFGLISQVFIHYFAGSRQVSPAAPTAEMFVEVTIGLRSTSPKDLNAASVTYPDESISSLPLLFGVYATSTLYFTKAEALSANPAGDYLFAIEGGVLGEQTATVTQPYKNGNWPTQVPAFSPATFTALQGMNPSGPFVLAFNPVVGGLGADMVSGDISIFDITTGETVFFASSLPAGTSSRTVPAGTLQPQHPHRIFLTFRSQHTLPFGAFDSTAPTLLFGHQTFADFTTGSGTCAADFNDDSSVNSADFFDFLTAFFTSAPAADFNADGHVNSQDFFDFLAAFFAGC